MAVVMTELGVAMPGQVKLATKQKKLAAEERRKTDQSKAQAVAILKIEQAKKEDEARRLRDDASKMEAEKADAAREAGVRERELIKIEVECWALEKKKEALEEEDKERRKIKEREYEEARKKAAREDERLRKAKNTLHRIIGDGWTQVLGKRLRNLTVIALTKARFGRGYQTTFDMWNKLVRELNALIICVEKADGGKPLFRIAGITCNPDISRFERRLGVIEARGDITDEEITAFLDT